MGVEIKGIDDIERTIKKKYSPKAIKDAEHRALKAGGHMLRNKIATELNAVRDTGELAIGTDILEPKLIGNRLEAKLHWRGEHRTLAYINEHGHYDKAGKWVKPIGAGKAQQTLTLNSDLYFKLIKKELNR